VNNGGIPQREAARTPVAQLWIPVVVSAVLVFVASSVIHMLLKWHDSDYRKLPNEDAVRASIRAANAAPGQFVIPHCAGIKEMQSPENQQKFREGPVGLLTLRARVAKEVVDGLIYGLITGVAFGWLWPR
jgi:hypothetical protein